MAIDRELPPLRGVIHAAMVLEDKLLVDLDRPTLERVLRPKVLGGWNLHHETLGRKLDLFILFSSLSSVFGHAGQANYAAANALLDSLAYHRRAQGLPALVMNWGHLGEVGYLAEREQLGQRLERQGVLSFTVQQATECLAYALNTQAIQLSVLRMDWSLWRGLGITNRVSPRFAHLLQQSAAESECEELITNAAGLRAAQGPRRATLVEGMLRNKAGALLGISPKQLPVDRALLELGLDSLMAVEFRNWIESQMQINIPISTLMRSDSLTALVAAICELIEATVASNTPQTLHEREPQVHAEELLESLPELGEEEVTRLLGEMLRQS
jgi:acyl carrier protein